jgi:hypothetical protein
MAHKQQKASKQAAKGNTKYHYHEEEQHQPRYHY